MAKRGIIMEIDNKPAINIYQKYLEEKFDVFIKNRLFYFYPLGIVGEGETRLINIIDYLEDGSLICMGSPKQNSSAHIMFLHPPLLFETLQDKLRKIKGNGEGLVFIIDSLIRRRILKEQAEGEIRVIKKHLGDKFKIAGIFTDYSIFPYKEKREIGMEMANLLLTLWK
jgi:hypothetical protein